MKVPVKPVSDQTISGAEPCLPATGPCLRLPVSLAPEESQVSYLVLCPVRLRKLTV